MGVCFTKKRQEIKIKLPKDDISEHKNKKIEIKEQKKTEEISMAEARMSPFTAAYRNNKNSDSKTQILSNLRQSQANIMDNINKLSLNPQNDTLEKLIDSDSINNSMEEFNKSLVLKEIKNEPLFNLVDFYVNHNSEYSTDTEWSQILKKAKNQNKSFLVIKLLNLKERRWNKENIIISDLIKENRENLDSHITTKYLNLRIKLQEHFNWLLWAISYYYYTLLFHDKTSSKGSFLEGDFGLPAVDTLEWSNGFEWKGIFIRVQTHEQSSHLFSEMKAFNYIFFEYVQLIENYKIKNKSEKKLLSNDLIFPIISYSNVSSLILMGSVCINKYNYEYDVEPTINVGNNVQFDMKKSTNSNKIKLNSEISQSQNLNNPIKKSNLFSSLQNIKVKNNLLAILNNENYKLYDENNEISNIEKQNESFNVHNFTSNINNDININNFNLEDFNQSVIFSKLEKKHLIRVIDDPNDYFNINEAKSKLMIISGVSLIPDLLDSNNKFEFLTIEEGDEPLKLFNFASNNVEKLHGVSNAYKYIVDQTLKKDIKTDSYEGNQMDLKYKILFHNEEMAENNNRVKEYFIRYYSKHISDSLMSSKYFNHFNNNKQTNLKNFYVENQNLNIKGKALLIFQLAKSIKLKYSLIKSNKLIMYNDFINKSGYFNLIEKFSKNLDNNLSINSIATLKEYFYRFGVNMSLSIFILPKIKNPKIADLIKMDILCKMIKKLLYFHEGNNIELKLNLVNSNVSQNGTKYLNENIAIMNDGFFDFIKEKSLYNIYKIKIYHSILSILQTDKSNPKFVNFFYDHLNYIFFIKKLKWLLVDNKLGFNLSKESEIFTSNLLTEFIETARKRPFMFLQSLEYHLKIMIDPLIKYKASIALEQFIFYFNETFIYETEPNMNSYIKPKEFGYYMFAKCSYNNLKHYDNYKNRQTTRTNDLTERKVYKSKINKDKINLPNTLNTLRTQRNEENVKNNITKVNNRYVESSIVNKFDLALSNSIDSDKKKITVGDEDLNFNWENLSTEMDLNFPSILYKLDFIFDDSSDTNTTNIYKYLKKDYSFNRIDIIHDWKSCLEMLLNDIITLDTSESVITQAYIFLLINAFYIDNDTNACKDIINKLKHIMRNLMNYKFDTLSIINLLEGLLVEKKNYIECEEFYSKSLIYALLNYGDPRGRGNYGSSFLLFPLWKLARQTFILENSLTNESFKEMFHCQDFQVKNLYEASGINTLNNFKSFLTNKYYISSLNYVENRKELIKKQNEMKLKVYTIPNKIQTDRVSLSDINFDDDVNEEQSIGGENKLYNISDRNFDVIYKYKSFAFPSISDVKSSYCTYLSSENFLLFLIKNMLNPIDCSISLDEEILDKLGLNTYSLMNTIDMSNSKANMQTNSSAKSTISRRDKNAIFSTYMYEYLLDKLSFKKTPPNSILLSWGNNSHTETSHNNYDFLSLPRIVYKLKDEEIYKMACGWEHNLIVTSKNKCYAWGNNESGQCSIKDMPIVSNPVLIESLENIREVSCGNEHSLALNKNGEVFSWGKSEDGVLGYIEAEIEYVPKKIKNLENVISVSCGSIHNMALDKNGSIYSWGCSKGGQLGQSESFLVSIPDFQGYLTTPTKVEDLNHKKVKRISCGEAHSLALTSDGKVFGWGFTSNGQLGIGICEDSFEPGQGMIKCRINEPRLIDMDANRITDVKCGKTFSTFITDKHEILVCGVNDLHQLGIDQPASVDHLYSKEEAIFSRCSDVVVPTPIEYFLNMKVRKIACGESHCLALVEDLSNKLISLWSWGSNRFGQLGQGNQVKKSMPKPINYMLGYTSSQVVDVACGAFHSLCVISNVHLEKSKNDVDFNRIKFIIDNQSSKWNFN